MGKQVKWTPPEDDLVVDQNEQEKPAQKWTPPEEDAIVEPVKKKDQPNQSASSSDSQDLGEPSGKSTTNTPQLSEKQKATFRENVLKTPEQKKAEDLKNKFVDTQLKDAVGIDETQSKGFTESFLRTVQSGLSDQIPKEYYAQRLRMSKGNFGDLYDRRSDINAFGGPEFSKQLPKGTSIDAFSEWNNKQDFKTKQKSYDERAKLFLTEKLGAKGFEDLKQKFIQENQEERLGYEKNIQQQNQEVAIKTAGVTQDLKGINGAGDFLSFAGNMIGQALYRAPINLGTGPAGSIISESASIYDQQLDLIAQKEGISREEVIKRGLDKPAEGQALAVLAGTLDAASEFNIVGLFKKAAGKQLTENVVKQFVKGFVRGAAPEAVTEAAQGEIEEFAASKGAGTEYHPDAWRIATNAVGAFIGGGVLGGGANVKLSPILKSMPTQDVVNTATTGQSSNNIKSIEQAADIIDAKVQDADDTTVTKEVKQEEQSTQPEFKEPVITQNQGDDALQISEPTGVLPSSQEGTGSEGSERGGVEPVEQGTGTAEQGSQQKEAGRTNEGTQEKKSILNQDTDLTGEPKEDFMLTEGEQIKKVPDKKSLVNKLEEIGAPKKLIESISKSATLENYNSLLTLGKVYHTLNNAGIENKIYISNLSKLFGYKDTIVHEAVHLASIVAIDDYLYEKENDVKVRYLTDSQRESLDYIDNIFQKAKKKSKVKTYGYTDLHEFFAEFISSEKFRNRLSRDLESKSIVRRVADSIINFIEELTGLSLSKSKNNDVLEQLNKINSEIENVYDGRNKVIQEAVRSGRYVAYIHLGKMTANDAKTIIESAGIKVPDSILKLAKEENNNSQQNTVENENVQQQEQTEAGLGGQIQSTEGETKQRERGGESGRTHSQPGKEEIRSEENGGNGRQRKKSLLNRAHEGVSDEQVKSSIEKHGLTYEVESHISAEKSAQKFIDDVGVENAIEAVRNNEVDDGAAAFVWAKAIDEVGRKLAAATDKNEIKELTDAQTNLIDEFDKKARSGGRFISALQDVYKSSDFAYKADYQIKKYKEVNNGKIPKEIEEKFRDLETKLNAANEKLQKLEESRGKESSKKTVQDIRTDLQAQKERRAKLAKERKEKIDNFFDSLKVKSDPNKLNSITQVIGESVWNGSIEVMRAAVLAGSDVAMAVQAGIDYVKEHYRGSDFDENQFRTTVEPGIERLVPTEEDVKLPTMRNGKLSIPRALIRQVVESGANTIEEVTNDIHDLIKDSMPEVSVREVRDAITKYGETRSLSKEDLDVKIRELKRVGRLVSSLEDVQNKLRPLRSGLQRDKLTDQERRMQRQVKEAMKDLPIDEDELNQQWKTALDAVKSRLKNQISDLEDQIKTGEKTPKKKGIKYDEEATALKNQRDALKKVIEDINGKNGISTEEKVRLAIKSVGDSIAEYERRIREKDFDKKKTELTPETPELREMRAKRDQIKQVYKQLEKDLGIADKKKLEAYKKNIKKTIDRYESRIKNKDFVTEKKKPLDLDKEAKDLRIERDKIKSEFELEQEKNRLNNRSLSEKAWDTFVDVVNLPKSMLASIDMSAPFRQGAVLSFANPKAGAASFAEMFRQAFSEKKATEWLAKLKESPVYDTIKKSKLYIAEPTTKLTAKEDQFISNFASKIPLFKIPYKASERAYTGYLNKLRVDVFVNGADRLQEAGFTPESNPEAYKAWADFINNATGRGNLGALEEAATVLNGFFFSPRFVASRVNLMNPIKYAKMPPEVRKMAMKNMIAFVGFSALVLTIASAAGADVEHDPRSSDFAKMRIGDTRYDILAGFQQVIRLFAQLSSGQRKSTSTGKITDLDGKKFPFENRGDVALRFARSKLAPSAGSTVNLLTGKDIVGQEVTIEGEAVKNVIPLYIQDIYSLYQKETPTGLVSSLIPAFFGVSVQNYSKKKEKPKEPISPW